MEFNKKNGLFSKQHSIKTGKKLPPHVEFLEPK